MSRSSGPSELYKDKIEVSLDGRQIFYLFFGGAVIVGLVFVLGVMVGRRVEARGHVERAQTQAAVDPLAALDRLEGGAGLSFQGSLRGADAPASDVDKTIGELARQREAARPNKKVDARVERPVVAPAVKPKPDKPEPEAKPVTRPEPEAKPVTKPERAAKAEAKPDKATAHTEDKKPEDKKPEDKKPEAKAKFTLQLSSFQDKDEALAYLAQVKANGFGAYVTEADVDGKTFYRVRMGNYHSLDAANGAKAELEKSTKKSATVMRL
jgi:cell division septation protein DedD